MTFLQLLEDNTAEMICGGGRRWSRPSRPSRPSISNSVSSKVKYDFDQDNDSDVSVRTSGMGWKGGIFAVTNENDVSQLNSIGNFLG